MRNGKFLLNRAGTRWNNFTNGQKDKVELTVNGKTVTRTVLYYELIGKETCMTISYDGQLITVPITTTDLTHLIR